MLEGLLWVDETVVPFLSMFHSSPSGYLWENNDGTTHTRADCGGPVGECVMGMCRDKHPPGQDEDVEPPGCEILERVARIQDLSAHVWRGPELPAEFQGYNILGTL